MKITDFREGKIYKNKAGGYAKLHQGKIYATDSLDADFTETEDLSLKDEFEETTDRPTESMRSLLTAYQADRSVSKETKLINLLNKVISEVEKLQK